MQFIQKRITYNHGQSICFRYGTVSSLLILLSTLTLVLVTSTTCFHSGKLGCEYHSHVASSSADHLTLPALVQAATRSQAQHYLCTNKGAHCYNGNGPTPGSRNKTKRQRSPTQPTLAAMFSNKRYIALQSKTK